MLAHTLFNSVQLVVWQTKRLCLVVRLCLCDPSCMHSHETHRRRASATHHSSQADQYVAGGAAVESMLTAAQQHRVLQHGSAAQQVMGQAFQ